MLPPQTQGHGDPLALPVLGETSPVWCLQKVPAHQSLTFPPAVEGEGTSQAGVPLTVSQGSPEDPLWAGGHGPGSSLSMPRAQCVGLAPATAPLQLKLCLEAVLG